MSMLWYESMTREYERTRDQGLKSHTLYTYKNHDETL